jgi:hypothetical protein
MSELHISQASQEHQIHPILTPYELVVKFCSKWVLSSFFIYFLRSSTCSHVAQTAQGLKDRVLRKKFVLPIASWFFHFFHFFLLLMSPSKWSLWFECEVFDFFQEILQGSHCWSFEPRPPSTKGILVHS